MTVTFILLCILVLWVVALPATVWLCLRQRWRLAWLPFLLAGILTLVLLPQQQKQVRRQKALQHYYAGLDEKQRGNPEAAAEQFQRALSLEPGTPEAAKELESLRQDRKPAPRVAEREAAIDPAAGRPAAEDQLAEGRVAEPKPAIPPHVPSPFEITRYHLDLDLNPGAHSLKAAARIDLLMRKTTAGELPFSLAPEFKPKRCRINGASVRWEHRDDLLALMLSHPLDSGATPVVEIDYQREGGPLTRAGDRISERGFLLRAETRWYPAAGELDFHAPAETTIRAPEKVTVLAPGRLMARTGLPKGRVEWRWKNEARGAMISLAGGQVSRYDGPHSGSATVYLPTELASLAPGMAAEAARIREYFATLFGEYPYSKLAITAVPGFPGGYGSPSLVILGVEVLQQAKPELRKELLAHEIAHQWWGNSVLPQGLGAGWVSEAFATYSSWMYMSQGPKGAGEMKRLTSAAASDYFSAVARAGDQPLAETDPYLQAPSSQAIVYRKGAFVLHMLRHHLGETRFKKLLKQFAVEYRFRRATMADWKAFANRAAGEDLGWFWDQWLHRKGAIGIEYDFVTETFQGKPRLRLTLRQPGAGFRARVPLDLEAGDQVLRRTIEMSGPAQVLFLPVPSEIRSVVFDPDGWLLMSTPRWQPGLEGLPESGVQPRRSEKRSG